MKKAHIVWGGLAVVASIILLGILTTVGTFNKFGRIETKLEAVQNDNKNVLDNTRKAIREAAAVSDKEVEALLGIIVGNSEARGPGPDGGDNNVVSIGMVTEAVPSITRVETLTKLQNIIVAGRKDWQAAQTNLLEVQRQGNEMFATFPSNMLLGVFGKEKLEVTIVTSTETEGNFATGEDNESWLGGAEK